MVQASPRVRFALVLTLLVAAVPATAAPTRLPAPQNLCGQGLAYLGTLFVVIGGIRYAYDEQGFLTAMFAIGGAATLATGAILWGAPGPDDAGTGGAR